MYLKREAPLRFFQQVGEAVEEVLVDAFLEHQRRDHVPPSRLERPHAVPFAGARIPDVHLAYVQQQIEQDGLTDEEACERFGYPPSLLARELARYRVRYRRWVQSGAGA